MKKGVFLFVSLFVLALSGCNSEKKTEEKQATPIDRSKLIMSCFINGTEWISLKDRNKPLGRFVDPMFTIGAKNIDKVNSIEIDIYHYQGLGKYPFGSFVETDSLPTSNISLVLTEGADNIPSTLGYGEMKSGFVEITEVDSINYKISGSFQFKFMNESPNFEGDSIIITEGKFTRLNF